MPDKSEIRNLLQEINSMVDDLEWQLEGSDEMSDDEIEWIINELTVIKDRMPLEICP
jgi:hypothetical protein